MKRLSSLHDRVTALTPGTGNSADGALPADLVKGYLGYDVVTLSPEDVLSLARLLSHLQDRLDDTEKLLAIFPDAHSGDEAMKLRACFLHAGIQFDYPSPVYREAALTALLQRFPEMDWKDEGEFANGFERLLNQLAEASRHLNEAERQNGELPSASSLWDGTLIKRRAAEWLGLYERLTNLYPECRAVVGRSPIGTIYHQIAAHDAGKSIQIVPDGCSAIFIFDTNALMDEGRLLEALSEEDFLVFPRVVIGELDKLKPKYSDAQRRSVRRNRIALEKMPPSRVRFVESDLDKLSRDAPRNNDARILSTAILYKDRNVTVVTGDGNFRIMCRSYDVPTMDTTAYLALKLQNGRLSR